MPSYWIGLLIGIGVLIVFMPYVRLIQHPSQTFLAAYLIFVLAFMVATAVLFMLFGWIAGALNLGASLGNTIRLAIFWTLVLVPSFVLASWQARKPPLRRGPPP